MKNEINEEINNTTLTNQTNNENDIKINEDDALNLNNVNTDLIDTDDIELYNEYLKQAEFINSEYTKYKSKLLRPAIFGALFLLFSLTMVIYNILVRCINTGISNSLNLIINIVLSVLIVTFVVLYIVEITRFKNSFKKALKELKD